MSGERNWNRYAGKSRTSCKEKSLLRWGQLSQAEKSFRYRRLYLEGQWQSRWTEKLRQRQTKQHWDLLHHGASGKEEYLWQE